MTNINFYSKEQTDALLENKADISDLPAVTRLLPDPSLANVGDAVRMTADGAAWEGIREVPDISGATIGDVLQIGSDGMEWSPQSGGGGEEWEDIDFNNWPTNWTSNDIIEVEPTISFTIPGTGTTPTWSPSGTTNTFIKMRVSGGTCCIPIFKGSTTTMSWILLSALNVNNFNTGTTPFGAYGYGIRLSSQSAGNVTGLYAYQTISLANMKSGRYIKSIRRLVQ